MKKYSTDSQLSASCNAVTIRELEPGESARVLYGMTYDAQLTTCGRICGIGHFCKTLEEAEEWAEVIKSEFPQLDFNMDPLSLSVACHIGYGSLAIACSKYIPECED